MFDLMQLFLHSIYMNIDPTGVLQSPRSPSATTTANSAAASAISPEQAYNSADSNQFFDAVEQVLFLFS